jgi:UDP-glucose 6-dehydrogenase
MERNIEAGRLHYTLDKNEAYRDADMIFICVGTPSDERGHTDLKYVNRPPTTSPTSSRKPSAPTRSPRPSS